MSLPFPFAEKEEYIYANIIFSDLEPLSISPLNFCISSRIIIGFISRSRKLTATYIHQKLVPCIHTIVHYYNCIHLKIWMILMELPISHIQHFQYKWKNKSMKFMMKIYFFGIMFLILTLFIVSMLWTKLRQQLGKETSVPRGIDSS